MSRKRKKKINDNKKRKNRRLNYAAHDNDGMIKKAVEHHRAGDLETAEEIYRRILAKDADYSDALHLLGLVAYQRGRYDTAYDRIHSAIRLQPDCASYHNSMGSVLMAHGRLSDAIEHFREATALDPNLSDAYYNLGNALMEQGDLDEAVSCYRISLDIKPDDLRALNNMGNAFSKQDKIGDAISCYCKALEKDPAYSESLDNLSSVLERTNRIEEAQKIAYQRLENNPENQMASLIAAKCERRQGRLQDAIDRLKPIAEDARGKHAKEVHFELGRLYDRIEESDHAFFHLKRAKALDGESIEWRHTNKDDYSEKIDRIYAHYTQSWLDTWHADIAPAAEPIAFIVGFPRSGTTLLEQIAGSHPKVQTLDEKPIAGVLEQVISALPGGYPDSLSILTDEEVLPLRKLYYQTLDQYLTLLPGCLLIDKLPLNIIRCGMLWRIFPNAKFIMALRHPYDVCLSCFMQEFKPNDSMAHFLNIESTALLYEKVMNLWRKYTTLLPFQYHIVRYESLVSDYEKEARALLAFLELEWHDAVLRYDHHAKTRTAISTPSYHQVTEKIYQRAAYRWRRYEKHLSPIIERLSPFVEHFGYNE